MSLGLWMISLRCDWSLYFPLEWAITPNTCGWHHPAVGSNQVGCGCTWQRSLPCETNIGATKEIPGINQSWRGCNHPTSNWPYQGHQAPYLVLRTTDCLEKAYETTWQYGIIRDLHRIGLRGRLPVFVSEYLRDRQIRVRIGTTLSDEYYPEEGVPTGGVLAVTCFGLKINELPSCIARDIFRALFVDDLSICFRGRSLDTIERHLQQAVNAIQ